MTTRYRRRRDHLVQAPTTYLPDWRVTGTSAGLHLLVHPAYATDEETALAALAQRCGLDARPLGDYAILHQARCGLVIGYGHQHPDRLEHTGNFGDSRFLGPDEPRTDVSLGSHPLEDAHPVVDVGEVGSDHRGYVSAGHLAAVSKVDPLAGPGAHNGAWA